MRRQDKRNGRSVVHLSAAVGARFIHDAAADQAVCVSDPRACRVLRRALLQVLRTKGASCLVRVSDEVAAALSGSRATVSERGSHHLAVGLGRHGRSAFLLRAIPDRDDIHTRRLRGEQMLDDLRSYLKSQPSILVEAPEDD